ncbi:MAG: hypothetical protein R2939_03915 [Kofleriaceae bacterium]
MCAARRLALTLVIACACGGAPAAPPAAPIANDGGRAMTPTLTHDELEARLASRELIELSPTVIADEDPPVGWLRGDPPRVGARSRRLLEIVACHDDVDWRLALDRADNVYVVLPRAPEPEARSEGAPSTLGYLELPRVRCTLRRIELASPRVFAGVLYLAD